MLIACASEQAFRSTVECGSLLLLLVQVLLELEDLLLFLSVLPLELRRRVFVTGGSSGRANITGAHISAGRGGGGGSLR